MIEIDFVQKDRLTELLLSEKWYIVLSVALVVPCIPIAGFLIQSLFTDFHPELRITRRFRVCCRLFSFISYRSRLC